VTDQCLDEVLNKASHVRTLSEVLKSQMKLKLTYKDTQDIRIILSLVINNYRSKMHQFNHHEFSSIENLIGYRIVER
jgi:hypothetical protein